MQWATADPHQIIRQRRRNLVLARMTPDLVYDQMKVAGAATSATGEAPIGLETVLGVRAAATALRAAG